MKVKEIHIEGRLFQIIQLPMSVEIGGGEAPVPICNLLFFMNPSEMESLLHDGLFHQLEYYANAYDNPSVQRSYNTLLYNEGGSVSMVRKIQLYLQCSIYTLCIQNDTLSRKKWTEVNNGQITESVISTK